MTTPTSTRSVPVEDREKPTGQIDGAQAMASDPANAGKTPTKYPEERQDNRQRESEANENHTTPKTKPRS